MSSSKEVLPDDPLQLKSIVGKNVLVNTVDNRSHSGILYVIDPIFKTVVICKSDRMKIILYHAIKSFEIESQDIVDVNIATFPSASVCDTGEDIRNKARLKKWLEHMYLEVEDYDGGLKVGEHLTIVAPYTRDSCISDNTIILDKIRKIIDVMPDNFPDKS